MTDDDGQNGFEAALDALLDRLADPDACAAAAEALAMLTEERVRGRDLSSWHEPAVPPELRSRSLTREEAERAVARTGDEIRRALARPEIDPGPCTRVQSLVPVLVRADLDLAVPALVELLVSHWERLSAREVLQVLRGLEKRLWAAKGEPSPLLVEQLSAYPRLRATLREIAREHWITAGSVWDVPADASDLDGHISVILAPPELRAVRDWTSMLRGNVGGTPELTRAIVQAAHLPIYSCVSASDYTEGPEEVGFESVLVLAPDGSLYRLRIETGEYGELIELSWVPLAKQQRAGHEKTIRLLQRVSELEQQEYKEFGSLPQADRDPFRSGPSP